MGNDHIAFEVRRAAISPACVWLTDFFQTAKIGSLVVDIQDMRILKAHACFTTWYKI
jgi:hypothetical protein